MSAGAFKKELDLSLYTEISSNFKVGLVGTFNKGAINTRTLLTNVPMLEATFGKPIDNDVQCQGFFAAREYLRKGNQLYGVRVESAATPADYSSGAIQGTTDENLNTQDDGVTSAVGVRELTPTASPTFVTAGVLVGDTLEIHDTSSPGDNGFYLITAVVETKVTVDRDWPAGVLTALSYTVWSSKREGGADGVTSAAATREFDSALSTFTTNGVVAGDVLQIHDSGTTDDNGYYKITSVDSATKLTLSRDFTVGGKTALDFTVYGYNSPDKADGSTAVAGEFSSALAKFQDHGVKAGDILVIEDAVDTDANGTYTISGLKTGSEDTVVEVADLAWPSSEVTLTYKVLPGCIVFSGGTKGTAYDGYDAAISVNGYDSTTFDVRVYDENDFLLETIFATTFATIVADMAASEYLTAAVVATRDGPAVIEDCTLDGGDNGVTGIVDADFIGSVSTIGLQLFSNTEAINIDCLVIPGKDAEAVGNALLAKAEDRGDCMSIADGPFNATVDTPSEAIDWHNGTGALGRTTALSSSYGAFYWSTLTVYDSYNAKSRELCSSAVALGVWAQSENATFPWFAPAGYKRGKITGATSSYYSPDIGERKAMQENGNSVNPIVNFERDGLTIFGQKTLLRSTSALNRIGVRRGLFYLEKAILSSAKYLAFDPNDEATWRELIRLIEPICEYMQSNRGLNDFLAICDSTTNTAAVISANKVISRILLKPTTTAEIIELQFALTAQSADFTEMLAA